MENQNTAKKDGQQPDPEAQAVERAVREVTEDARSESEAYLKDTIVPAGGE